MHLVPSKRRRTEEASPPLYAGRKLGDVAQALLWKWLHEDPGGPSRVVLDKVAHTQAPLPLSVRPRNRLRVTWQLHRGQGRPRHTALSRPVAADGEVGAVTPQLSSVGVPLFAHGLDHQESCAPVVTRLQQASEA